MEFTPISDLGEFGLIDKIRPYTNEQENVHLLKGIGDDAAVFEVPAEQVQVLTTDALIEGVHFDRTFTPLRYLGFKAISVNVSDVCAMNAVPKYLTVALGLPHNMSVEMVEELYAGMQRACELYNVQLIGGDTTASRQLVLGITAIGFASKEKIVYRSGAQVGDVICVSGDVGAAYAGLKVLLEEKKAFKEADIRPDLSGYEYALQRHFTPTARLDIQRYFSEMGLQPTAMMDISDGLASEIKHICKQSNTGALIETVHLPIELETRQIAERFGEDPDTFALFGGDDYELIFTLPLSQIQDLSEKPFTIIGTIQEPEMGIHLLYEDGGTMPLEGNGFTHF